jgi:hypothetical protein
VAEVEQALAHAEQHLHPSPLHARQRADAIEELEQHPVAAEDVVIAERVDVAFALEAAGEAAEFGGLFDQRDLDAGAGQFPGRGEPGQPATEHDRGARVAQAGPSPRHCGP